MAFKKFCRPKAFTSGDFSQRRWLGSWSTHGGIAGCAKLDNLAKHTPDLMMRCNCEVRQTGLLGVWISACSLLGISML